MSERFEPVRNREPHIDPVDPLPPALLPDRASIEGRYAIVEPLDARTHAEALFDASHGTPDHEAIWTYLPYGPFPGLAAFQAWTRSNSASADPLFFAIRKQATGEVGGQASLMSIEPLHGSIEIGHIMLGLPLQNTTAATEALVLLAAHAIDDRGYRRLEWKCDASNAPSRRAAVRLGFAFEGLFYQHRIVKGRNRDTAWYSMLDSEWPEIRGCFERWLDPLNFDDQGHQRTSLSDLTREARRRLR